MNIISFILYLAGTALLSGGIGFVISQKITEKKMEAKIQQVLDEISVEINNLLQGSNK